MNLDLPNERSGIVHDLAPRYWGRGSLPKLMDRAFRPYSLNRNVASDPKNIGSWKVVEKLGMKRECLLRRHLRRARGYRLKRFDAGDH